MLIIGQSGIVTIIVVAAYLVGIALINQVLPAVEGSLKK
jgi:hypothetical protein